MVRPLEIFAVTNLYLFQQIHLQRVAQQSTLFDVQTDRSFMALINPEITKYEGEQSEDYEGCLSVTDLYGKVMRYSKIRLKALNQNGKEIRLTAEGFLARVLQHEIDHTNGILFVDHIRDNHDAFYRLEADGKLNKLEYSEAIKNLWPD